MDNNDILYNNDNNNNNMLYDCNTNNIQYPIIIMVSYNCDIL